MNLYSKKSIYYLVIVVVLAFLAIYIWLKIDIGINRKSMVLRIEASYSSYFRAKSCERAYSYLSEHSKNVNGYSKFLNSCSNNDGVNLPEIQREVIFENRNTSKIITTLSGTIQGSTVEREQVRTWVRESGTWKRDWPD